MVSAPVLARSFSRMIFEEFYELVCRGQSYKRADLLTGVVGHSQKAFCGCKLFLDNELLDIRSVTFAYDTTEVILIIIHSIADALHSQLLANMLAYIFTDLVVYLTLIFIGNYMSVNLIEYEHQQRIVIIMGLAAMHHVCV